MKLAFQCARQWGVQPSEFWAMSIEEWWWEFDANRKPTEAANMSGAPSASDWERARREHREKMKNGRSS